MGLSQGQSRDRISLRLAWQCLSLYQPHAPEPGVRADGTGVRVRTVTGPEPEFWAGNGRGLNLGQGRDWAEV